MSKSLSFLHPFAVALPLVLLTACPFVDVLPDAADTDGGSAIADGGVSPEANPNYVDANEAIASVRRAFEVGCQRLHSDCQERCDGVWVYCGDSVEQCVDEYMRAYFEDLTFPMVSAALAQTCARDVVEASCQDLEPNTYACEHALIDGCFGDDDAYGQNYAPHVAAEVGPLPATLTLDVCDEIREYFKVDLGSSTALTVNYVAGVDFRLKIYRISDGPSGVPLYSEIESTRLNGTSRAVVEIDIPDGGDLLLEVEPFGPGTATFTLEASAQSVSLLQGLEQVWGTACSRLHSDCAAHCDGPAAFCGNDVTDCQETFVNAFWDQSWFDNPQSGNALANCVAALEASTCAALDPRDVPSCEAFVDEIAASSCLLDPQGWMRAVVPEQSTPLSLPATQTLPLCNISFEDGLWFTLALNAQDAVTVRRTTSTEHFVEVELFADTGGPEPAPFDDVTIWSGDTQETLAPVPVTGTYYLVVELGSGFENTGLDITVD